MLTWSPAYDLAFVDSRGERSRQSESRGISGVAMEKLMMRRAPVCNLGLKAQ